MDRVPYSFNPMYETMANQAQKHGEHVPFSPQTYSPYHEGYQNEWVDHNPYVHHVAQAQPYSPQPYQNPFQQLAKPSQPVQLPHMSLNEPHQLYYPSFDQQQQPRPTFMSQFQGEDGQLDLNKMISTVGHLANTVQQVTPVIQQVSLLMKSFKA